jgi:hypothetical protein
MLSIRELLPGPGMCLGNARSLLQMQVGSSYVRCRILFPAMGGVGLAATVATPGTACLWGYNDIVEREGYGKRQAWAEGRG